MPGSLESLSSYEQFHREKRAVHAAEVESIRERLTAFRAAAEAAGEVVARSQVPQASQEEDLPPGASLRISHLAARVIAARQPGETFGGAAITREINQRYGKRLRRPARTRNVATALRRMASAGRIVQVAPGRAHREAQYSRRG